MEPESDQNGMFIRGMSRPEALIQFIQRKFPEQKIQDAYSWMLEQSKNLGRASKLSSLQAFWKLLDEAYRRKAPPLQCGKGCAHCCYTGVTLTQLEWDGILKYVEENDMDLDQIMQRSERTINRVRKVLESDQNPDHIDWHQQVINQPCPFLGEDQACEIYEVRPLDCRLVVAFSGVCQSKQLEYAQRGVVIEEAVGSTVIAKLQHDQTPKIKQRKFKGTQPLRLFQHWLIHWKKKKSKKKRR